VSANAGPAGEKKERFLIGPEESEVRSAGTRTSSYPGHGSSKKDLMKVKCDLINRDELRG